MPNKGWKIDRPYNGFTRLHLLGMDITHKEQAGVETLIVLLNKTLVVLCGFPRVCGVEIRSRVTGSRW